MTDQAIKEAYQKVLQQSGSHNIRSLRARQLLGLTSNRKPAGGNKPTTTLVRIGSADEIQRLFFACVIFQTLFSSLTAKKYFSGSDVDDPRKSDPIIGCRRRFGISEDRFWELRNWLSFDPGVL